MLKSRTNKITFLVASIIVVVIIIIPALHGGGHCI